VSAGRRDGGARVMARPFARACRIPDALVFAFDTCQNPEYVRPPDQGIHGDEPVRERGAEGCTRPSGTLE
jgi:hypothetical protein